MATNMTQLPNCLPTPGFLQLLQWIARPISYMEACAKRYRDIFTMQLDTPTVFVSNPQALQQILSNDTKDFEAPGELNSIFKPLLGKQSVITISGAQHQRQRRLLIPPFHGERMKIYGQVINDVTEGVINQWQIGKPFSVRSVTQAITLQIMMQAVFGLYHSPRAQLLQQLVGEFLDQAGTPLSVTFLYFPFLQRDLGPLTPWGRQLRLQREVDQLLYEEIRDRRENPDPSRTDILSLLMGSRDEEGQPMTDEELHDELMTLLVAGNETTATALAWAFYWIHKLPAVREKLLEELDRLDDNPDPNIILKLPYLNAVCSETLRIYPVAMLTLPRVVKTPLSLMGYELEPGTLVVGSIYLLHHREDLYPQPEQFKPERFLERQFSPYEYLPFGGGARRCIGQAFAQFEMKMALAKILSCRELELVDRGEVQAKRRGLVTAPDRPVQMVVKSERALKASSLELINN